MSSLPQAAKSKGHGAGLQLCACTSMPSAVRRSSQQLVEGGAVQRQVQPQGNRLPTRRASTASIFSEGCCSSSCKHKQDHVVAVVATAQPHAAKVQPPPLLCWAWGCWLPASGAAKAGGATDSTHLLFWFGVEGCEPTSPAHHWLFAYCSAQLITLTTCMRSRQP